MSLNRRSLLRASLFVPLLGCAPDSNDSAVHRLVRNGGGVLPGGRYEIDSPVFMPPGCSIRISTGAEIVWRGAVAPAGRFQWIFVANDDCTIEFEAGSTIRCSTPSPSLWAIYVPGRQRVRVAGVQARNLNLVYTNISPKASDYRSVRAEHLCHDVTISRCGVVFDVVPINGRKQSTAAAFMGWADGWRVEDCTFRNVTSGVQWWGGDAAPEHDGAVENERKCRNGSVTRVSVRNSHGAGIWGSMGTDIMVTDCSVSDCGDVGCDAEGSFDVTWIKCAAARCKNGAFAQFYNCRRIVYRDCTAIATSDGILLGFYGKSATYSEGTRIIGGQWQDGRIALQGGQAYDFEASGLQRVQVDPSLIEPS